MSCWCKPVRDLVDRSRVIHRHEWTDEAGVLWREEVQHIDEDPAPFHERVLA
jgi:hypothetical protein